jgi:hypothetical protein
MEQHVEVLEVENAVAFGLSSRMCLQNFPQEFVEQLAYFRSRKILRVS